MGNSASSLDCPLDLDLPYLALVVLNEAVLWEIHGHTLQKINNAVNLELYYILFAKALFSWDAEL